MAGVTVSRNLVVVSQSIYHQNKKATSASQVSFEEERQLAEMENVTWRMSPMPNAYCIICRACDLNDHDLRGYGHPLNPKRLCRRWRSEHQVWQQTLLELNLSS